MYEIIPIVAGVVLALSTQGLDAFPYRIPALIVGSMFFGAIAALVSGELALSWAFLVFDAAQVLLAAFATSIFVAVWKRRFTR